MVSSSSLSLKQASELAQRTKSTILKSIQNGRISAEKDSNGEWRIEAVELSRVYRLVVHEPVKSNTTNHPKSNDEQAIIEHLREQLRIANERIDEWKTRAEQEAEERRALTRMITDHRATKAGFWSRLRGRS
jgi:endonuclease/exonuclease/phosphatase (EEP) superfamily protein YafD